MCGIAGLIRHGGLTPEDREDVARLCPLLHHRGPNGDGLAFSGDAALVQTRLSLVDLNPYPLPLQSPGERYTLLYNGEIYNHRELRRELQANYAFRTRTDTEVALAALIAWGPAALSRFEGMFSLFFWDRETNSGLAAVDPLSVKPLLYHHVPGLFLFASEAAPLIRAGLIPFRPNEEAIAEFLTAPYFSSTYLLPFDNLQRVLPGHYLEVRDGRAISSEYKNRATAPPSLLPALRRAVAYHSASNASVGVFLSGGVDSSLLAALTPNPLPAFTIDYNNRPEDFAASLIVRSDDLPFARQAAALYSQPHIVTRPADFEAALDRTLATNDLISAWEQEVSQNLLAERASQHVKAVLVGDAADETHYGYSFLLHPERISSPRLLIDFFGAVPTRLGPEYFEQKYRAFTADRGHNWDDPDSQRRAISCLIRHFWLTRLLHNGDIHLMAHSLEGRVPYSDPAVLAFGDSVSLDRALVNGIEKHHLRSAAAQALPSGLAWRPKSALTKHLAARQIIHKRFREHWARHGPLIEPHVDPDWVESLAPPEDDRESGIRFRLLSLLTWYSRFSESASA